MRQILFKKSICSSLKVALVLVGLTTHFSYANNYSVEVANRFSTIYSESEVVSAQQLKERYLNSGSTGLDIFKNRIKSEEYLANAIALNPQHYEKAIAICLPVVNEIRSEAEAILSRLNIYLNMTEEMSISFLFGANNTGGTASSKGVAIALEVICQQINTPKEAKKILLNYIAHEIVHVFQYRVSKRKDFNFTLLDLSLIEGVADLIAEEVLIDQYVLDTTRNEYGEIHEAQLWKKFQLTMFGMNYAPWMYSTPKDNRPIDLGYWMGKKIALAYMQQHENKKEALSQLLALEDSKKILKQSGYNP
jgi:hypothetical protein